MDTDNDGKVTYEELKAGLRKVGSQLAEPEIRMLMDVVSFSLHLKAHTILFNLCCIFKTSIITRKFMWSM